MHKLTKLIYNKLFLILFILCVSFSLYGEAFALEGARYYQGFSGINASNAFSYEGGRARDGTQNTNGYQGHISWGIYNFSTTQSEVAYFGVQYNQYDYVTNEDYGKWCGDLDHGRINRTGGTSYPITFTIINTDILTTDNIPNDLFSNPSSYSGSSAYYFGTPDTEITNKAQSDGTCKYQAIYYNIISNDWIKTTYDIPNGNYAIVLQNGFSGLGSGFHDIYDSETYYYKLNGDYNKYTQKMLIGTDNSVLSNASSWELVTADLNDGAVDNLNWYLAKSDTEIVEADDPFLSCNPFSTNIDTLFLNLNFSLGKCLSGLFIYLFYPSDEALNVFEDIYEQIKTKPPFGYGFLAIEKLTTLDLDSDPMYEIEVFEPLQDLLFDPLREGLVWILWLGFFIFLIYRFKHFHF